MAEGFHGGALPQYATVIGEEVSSTGAVRRAIAPQSKATYSASAAFTPPATPTDMVTIFGSATKTVRVHSFKITTNNTAAGSQTFLLIKRSAVNTTGTFVAGTAVPHDSANGAATAAVGHYTANAGGLGAAVGTLATVRRASPVLVPGSFAGVTEDAGFDLLANEPNSQLDQPITLRGVAEGLCLNFAGAALVAGQVHAYNITWTEE